MGGTTEKGGSIEPVSMVRAAGSGMLSPPWGRDGGSVEANLEQGHHILVDWRRRVVVFELRDDAGKVTALRYVPLERVDSVTPVLE